MYKFIGLQLGPQRTTPLTIAFEQEGQLLTGSSKAGEDVEKFLLKYLLGGPVKQVFVGAPLSLPAAYFQPKLYNDYLYRACDRELNSDSPMVLGGLTARAIRLKAILEAQGIKTYETNTSHQLKRMALSIAPQAELDVHKTALLARVQEETGLSIPPERIERWDQAHALLAFVAGYRYQQGKSEVFGLEKEGFIIV